MDAWLLVAAAVVSGVALAASFKTQGAIFATASALLSLWTTGTLVSNQAINVGSVSGTCSTFGPNCGYNLPAADVQTVIMVLSIYTIVSFLVVVDIVWPRTDSTGMGRRF